MEKQWNSSVWQRSNQGDLRSLEYRIKQNASEVNIQDIGGRTPLHWAVDSNNFTTAEFLLQNGADCTIQDSAGATVLDYVDKLYIKTENLDTEKINQLRWNCFPGLIEQNEQQLTEKMNWENLLAKYNGKRASAPAYFSSTEPKQKVNVGHDTAVSDDPSSSKFWNGQPVTQEEVATNISIFPELFYSIILIKKKSVNRMRKPQEKYENYKKHNHKSNYQKV